MATKTIFNPFLDKRFQQLSIVTGGGTSNYYHVQILPSNAWTVNHSLGRYPNITVRNASGKIIEADIVYTDSNNVTINFKKAGSPVAITGTAYFS